MDKETFRVQFRAVRRNISASVGHDAAQNMAVNLTSVLTQLHARFALSPPMFNLAFYWPFGDEIDCRNLVHKVQKMGYHVLLPCVVERDKPLTFRLFGREDELTSGAFGILEPPENSEQRYPDVIFAPLLSYDRFGGRLGYGGGYYDRTVAALRQSGHNVMMIGLGYTCQMSDQRLPMEPFDVRLDGVWTERALEFFDLEK